MNFQVLNSMNKKMIPRILFMYLNHHFLLNMLQVKVNSVWQP